MKVFIGLILGLSLSAQAATVFDAQVNDKQKKSAQFQQVWLSETVARVNNDPDGKRYSLLYLDGSDKSYFIDTEKKVVMDLSEPPPMPPMPKNAPETKAIKAELKKHGEGPVIAGYATDEYHIYADGQLCRFEYLSAEVLGFAHVKTFLETMKKRSEIQQKQQAHLPFMSNDVCDTARQQVADQLISKGAVLRSSDAVGTILFDMQKIGLEQAPKAGYFELPPNFAVMTVQQMMQEMMQKILKSQPAPAAPATTTPTPH